MLEAKLTARLQRLLPELDANVLGSVTVKQIAALIADDARRYIDSPMVHRKLRKALSNSDVLAEWWPLESAFACTGDEQEPRATVAEVASNVALAEYLRGTRPLWPRDASTGDVAMVLRRHRKDSCAKWLAERIEAGRGGYINLDVVTGGMDLGRWALSTFSRLRAHRALRSSALNTIYRSVLGAPVVKRGRKSLALFVDSPSITSRFGLLEQEVEQHPPHIHRVMPSSNELANEGVIEQAAAAMGQWYAPAVAAISMAEKRIEADRSKPVFKVGGSKPNRDVMLGLSTNSASDFWGKLSSTRGGSIKLEYDGYTEGVQLAFPFDGDISSINRALIQSMIDDGREDALRIYLLIHDLAAHYGTTGQFVMTLDDALSRTIYGRRVGNQNLTRAEAARTIAKTLRWFHRLEIKVERKRGKKRYWMSLGDVVSLKLGVDELADDGAFPVMVAGHLNKTLYRGAKKGSKRPNFTLFPSELHLLPNLRELRAAVLLVYDMHKAKDACGIIRRKASTLWRYLDLKQLTERKRWPQCGRATGKALSLLARVLEFGWSIEGDPSDPEAIYAITPPPWWQDRVLHGVGPSKLTTVAGTPRTGAELKDWRKRHKLGLREVAKRLDVSYATVRNRENKPDAALPTAWVEQLST